MRASEKRLLAVLGIVSALCITALNAFSAFEAKARASTMAARLAKAEADAGDIDVALERVNAELALKPPSEATPSADIALGVRAKAALLSEGLRLLRYSEIPQKGGQLFEFTVRGQPLSLARAFHAIEGGGFGASIPSCSMKLAPGESLFESTMRIEHVQ